MGRPFIIRGGGGMVEILWDFLKPGFSFFFPCFPPSQMIHGRPLNTFPLEQFQGHGIITTELCRLQIFLLTLEILLKRFFCLVSLIYMKTIPFFLKQKQLRNNTKKIAAKKYLPLQELCFYIDIFLFIFLLFQSVFESNNEGGVDFCVFKGGNLYQIHGKCTLQKLIADSRILKFSQEDRELF